MPGRNGLWNVRWNGESDKGRRMGWSSEWVPDGVGETGCRMPVGKKDGETLIPN